MKQLQIMNNSDGIISFAFWMISELTEMQVREILGDPIDTGMIRQDAAKEMVDAHRNDVIMGSDCSG
jgi:hypothetical protein